LKIAIVGAGNMGYYLAHISHKIGYETYLYQRKTEKKKFETISNLDEKTMEGMSDFLISKDLSEVIKNARYIFVTLPSNSYEEMVNEINQLRSSKSVIGFVPGSGGVELLEKGNLKSFFGLQRVPITARGVGDVLEISGKKKAMYFSCSEDLKVYKEELKELLESLIGIQTKYYSDYLNVSLVSSNALLHPARLYDYLSKASSLEVKRKELFYTEWTDNASDLLIKMDNELQSVIKKLNEKKGRQIIAIPSIMDYYEVSSKSQLTQKIRSINAFKNIYFPYKVENEKLFIDRDSRYFKEDFPYGLGIIQYYAKEVDIKTPNIDAVMNWYNNL